MGKTALALNIARNAATASKAVMFISLEMSAGELGDRLLSAETGISSSRMRTGTVGADQRRKLVDAAGKLSGLRLHIEDSATLRVGDIAALARRSKRSMKGLDLLIIDYIQLIQEDDSKSPRQEQVALISKRIKATAKTLGCPVLLLAQLNRDVEKSTDHRPRLSSIRESGGIEQDADVVMFVHREEYYLRGQDKEDAKGKAEIIVAKQRNGPTEIVNVAWAETCGVFSTLASSRLERAAATEAKQYDFGSYGEEGF
jgi:replicative DNA helicase